MSPDLKKKIKLAAVQAASVPMDREATTEKVCQLIREAGENGADVIGFPEGFIPSLPSSSHIVPVDKMPAKFFHLGLVKSAVDVPGPEVEAIQYACRDANIYAVVGIIERRLGATSSLYNTQLTFGRDGQLLHKHQKYVPTEIEVPVRAPGTTGSKASVPTDFGCLSSLICGENGNPLAIYSLSLDHPTVHVASWPAHLGVGSDLQDRIQIMTRGLANSLSCFVINSVTAITDDMVFKFTFCYPETREFVIAEQKKRRASIIAPGGEVIAGDLEDEEGILYADIDLTDERIMAKRSADYTGRPEIFAHHFEQFLK